MSARSKPEAAALLPPTGLLSSSGASGAGRREMVPAAACEKGSGSEVAPCCGQGALHSAAARGTSFVRGGRDSHFATAAAVSGRGAGMGQG